MVIKTDIYGNEKWNVTYTREVPKSSLLILYCYTIRLGYANITAKYSKAIQIAHNIINATEVVVLLYGACSF